METPEKPYFEKLDELLVDEFHHRLYSLLGEPLHPSTLKWQEWSIWADAGSGIWSDRTEFFKLLKNGIEYVIANQDKFLTIQTHFRNLQVACQLEITKNGTSKLLLSKGIILTKQVFFFHALVCLTRAEYKKNKKLKTALKILEVILHEYTIDWFLDDSKSVQNNEIDKLRSEFKSSFTMGDKAAILVRFLLGFLENEINKECPTNWRAIVLFHRNCLVGKSNNPFNSADKLKLFESIFLAAHGLILLTELEDAEILDVAADIIESVENEDSMQTRAGSKKLTLRQSVLVHLVSTFNRLDLPDGANNSDIARQIELHTGHNFQNIRALLKNPTKYIEKNKPSRNALLKDLRTAAAWFQNQGRFDFAKLIAKEAKDILDISEDEFVETTNKAEM